MRAQAQGRSSAANSDSSAARGSVFGRIASATRASSPSVDGSGALSARRRAFALISLSSLLALLVFAAIAGAVAKEPIFTFGSSGNQGGQFTQNRGIAVNTSGNGATSGTVYVMDFGNNRVQAFDSDGNFRRAWGWDVIISGRPGDTGTGFEVCTVAVDCKAGVSGNRGGQFSGAAGGLTVNQATGDVYVLDRNNVRVQQFSATGSFIRAWGKDVIATVNEVQTVTVNAGAGDFRLTFNGQTTGDLAWNVPASGGVGATASMQNALNALSSISPGSVTVTGGPGAPGGGTYTVTFATGAGISGTDVPPITFTAGTTGLSLGTGGGADTVSFATTTDGGGASTGPEICTVIANCKIGVNGTQAGEFNFATTAIVGIASDSSSSNPGSIYVSDANIARVQKFSPAGVPQAVAGWNVVSSGPDNAAEMQRVTVDAASGTFTLSFGATPPTTTNPIAANASAATIRSELAALGDIGGVANVSVTGPAGGPWTVHFIAARGNFDQPNLTFDGTNLVGDSPNVDGTGPSIAVAEAIRGGQASGFEVCDVATNPSDVCAAGSAGAGVGQFAGGGVPSYIAAGPAGDVYVIGRSDGTIYRFDSGLSFDPTFAPAGVADGGNNRHVLAVNAADNHLFFGRQSPDANLYELDPVTQTIIAANTIATGSTQWVGLGINSNTGRMYGSAGTSATQVTVFDEPLEPPAAVLNPIGAVGSTSAALSGTVDPLGGPLDSCRFQASDNPSFAGAVEVTEPDCTSLIFSGGPQAVGETITGLIPNTHYYARIVVTRSVGGPSFSNVRTFDTPGVGPVVSDVGAVQVSDRSARFVATIDAQNAETAYTFEYGTSPALGSTTAPLSAGSGSEPVTLSQVVGGLSPNTTYYVRASASNSFGSAASTPLATFTTRSEPLPLPDNRGYEQVTPDALNNADAGILNEASMTVARDGQALGVCNFYPPEGEGLGFCGADYISRRTEAGWQSKSYLPPTCRVDPATGTVGGGIVGGSALFSENLDLAVFSRPEWSACPFSPTTLDPGAQTDVTNFYRGDLISGTYDLLAPSPVTGQAFRAVNASDDFGVVFYTSDVEQTIDAPPGIVSLYEWDHGTLSLASIQPNSTSPFAQAVGPIDPGLGGLSTGASTTGDRVFFYSPPAGTERPQLYMRENGATTYDIGESECTVDCGVAGYYKYFAGASEDGSMVLLETPEKLSDDDNVANNPSTTQKDLYLYRQTANPGSERNLYVLSRDEEPADGIAAGYRGVIGRSTDGKTVFFATSGQIVPDAPTAAGFKVYRWRWNEGSPTIDFLANLDGTPAGTGGTGYDNDILWTDENNWTSEGRGTYNTSSQHVLDEPVRRVTPDGEHLTIDTIKRLDPVADADATRDVYRWDEAHGWRCVSCQTPGSPSAGVSQTTAATGIGGRNDGAHHSRLPMLISTPDGEKIFFTSRDELVPQDTNGTVRDVYEWNDGTVSLISSGTSDEDNLLVGVSNSGDDVFFMTSQRLVGWDNDELKDIYNARVGGGFPEPPPGTPCPDAEACRGAAPAPPSTTGAGSAAFQGPGNPRKASNNRTCARISKKAERKAARARKATGKKAQKLRKQAKNLRRRAERCNRRASR